MLNLLRTMWRYAGTDRPKIILFYAMFVGANLVHAAQPLVLGRLIDALGAGGPDILRELMFWSFLLWFVVFVYWSFHGPARIIENRVAFRIYERYVHALYRRVVEMPLQWHQAHHSGDTLGRVGKASKALFQFSQMQFMNVEIAVGYFGSLFYLAWLCWWLALIVLVLSALVLLVVRLLDRKLIKMVHETNEREHYLSAGLYDYIGNIVSVLTLRLGGRTRDEIARRFGAMRQPFYKKTLYAEKKWFALSMGVSLMRASMLALYIVVVMRDGSALELGTLVAIFQYLGSINETFFYATWQSDRLLQLNTDLVSVEALESDHAALTVRKRETHAREFFKEIEIENLSFTHHEGEDSFHHVADVAFRIKSGQKIALVGASGSGKTTLLALLRGLYEARSVRLKLDGESFDNLSPLAEFTTLVPQDAEIFENTIRYNLTMGVDVPDPIVSALLAMVELTDMVESFPEGVETDIRERGVNLSGGQKQRLALARGLLAARDSALLLLDEPTSSVDMATEEKIVATLFDTYPDKAIVASLHRLHLLPRFDWIILMKGGRIVEQGSFQELLSRAGPFQTLWRRHASRKEENR